MSDGPSRYPDDVEMKRAFEAYVCALGRVAFAWNKLFDVLSFLYVRITEQDRHVALQLWHAKKNDRDQLRMLENVVRRSGTAGWKQEIYAAEQDLLWLIAEVEELAENRNDAIHAPTEYIISRTGHGMEPIAQSFHRRARNLTGKQLIAEFRWCELWALQLRILADMCGGTLVVMSAAQWPDRPDKPPRPANF